MASDFYERVYQVVRLVPYGRVSSYGAIARFIGAPKAARTVGYAMNASVGMDDIAAHRIVNRLGLLSGKHHFGGSMVMQELLENEGIRIKDNQVQDFKEVFWDPNVELKRADFIDHE
jgi:methylated-DNA-protein-cysteine methyltransferase-like protein